MTKTTRYPDIKKFQFVENHHQKCKLTPYDLNLAYLSKYSTKYSYKHFSLNLCLSGDIKKTAFFIFQ